MSLATRHVCTHYIHTSGPPVPLSTMLATPLTSDLVTGLAHMAETGWHGCMDQGTVARTARQGLPGYPYL